jgi:hypothetical protein
MQDMRELFDGQPATGKLDTKITTVAPTTDLSA